MAKLFERVSYPQSSHFFLEPSPTRLSLNLSVDTALTKFLLSSSCFSVLILLIQTLALDNHCLLFETLIFPHSGLPRFSACLVLFLLLCLLFFGYPWCFCSFLHGTPQAQSLNPVSLLSMLPLLGNWFNLMSIMHLYYQPLSPEIHTQLFMTWYIQELNIQEKPKHSYV